MVQDKMIGDEATVPVTIRVTSTARKIMKIAGAMFDLTYSEVADSALKEWAQRHGMKDQVLELGNSIKGGA